MKRQDGKSGKSAAIVVLSFVALVLLFSFNQYSDYDLWWHLRLGESILSSGAPAYTDSFSYTYDGRRQYAGEWLADLIIFLSYRFGGIAGVNALKALVLLGTFFFLFKVVRSDGREDDVGFASAFLTLVAVLFAIRFRLFVRPYLFSLFFMAFFLFVLGRYRKTGNVRILYFLPLAEVIWANMSVAAILGPVTFFLFAVDEFVHERRSAGRNMVLFAGLTICAMANPETYRIYTLTLDLSSDPYRAAVGEYQPMGTHILWGYGLKYTLGFQILAVGAAIYFLVLKGWRNIYLLLMYVLFLVESLLQIRIVEFFSLVAAPAFAVSLERVLAWLSAFLPNRKMALNIIVAAVIVLAVPASVVGNKTYVLGNGIKKDAFPEDALAFLEKQRITGRMFNSYSFGGYIIWHAPGRKVFFDGRYRRLYDPQFYRLYTNMVGNAAAWQAAELQYGFDYAVVEYDTMSRRFPLHLNSNPNWALVYWDNHSAVYVKRTPANRATIEAYEYRLVKPTFCDFAYLDKYVSQADITGALTEINREIALNPANQEPLLAKVFLLYRMGRPYLQEMLLILETADRLKPDLAMKHSALAYVLAEYGQMARARNEVMKAIALDPLDPGALDLGKKMGIKMKQPEGFHH